MLLVASALTPVPINGTAADWTARSYPAPLRRLVEMTEPGHRHVARQLDAARLARQALFEVHGRGALGWNVKRRGSARLVRSLKPEDLHGHACPSMAGIGDDQLAAASSSGTPGMTTTVLGDADGICQSTPAGLS